MKKVISTTALGLSLILGTSSFMSCKQAKSEQATQHSTHHEMAETVKSPSKKSVRTPVVFLTGYDKDQAGYYEGAKKYFGGKNYQLVEGTFAIEEIIDWLNTNATAHPYGDIHIVNNNKPQFGLQLETTVNGTKASAKNLQECIDNGSLPALKNVLTDESKLIFHINELAQNTQLINTLKAAFITDKTPQIIASPYFSVFGGSFSNHYMAQPYYVFYPTAESPGKVDLSKEIAKKYPNEKEIEWYSALTNERERYVGEPYTKQYNVPVTLEIDYKNSDDEIPSFTSNAELISWITNHTELKKEVEKLNIPVHKFRWRYRVKDSQLTITGLSTVLCVLKPITKPYGDLEHVKPDTNNKRLYAMK